MVRDLNLLQPFAPPNTVNMMEVLVTWYDKDGVRFSVNIPAVFRNFGYVPATGRGGNQIGEVLNDLRAAQLKNFYQRLPMLGSEVQTIASNSDEQTVSNYITDPLYAVSRARLSVLSGIPDEGEGTLISAKVFRVGMVAWADSDFRVGQMLPIQLADEIFYPPSPRFNRFVVYKRPECDISVDLFYEPLPQMGYRLNNSGSFTAWDYNSYD